MPRMHQLGILQQMSNTGVETHCKQSSVPKIGVPEAFEVHCARFIREAATVHPIVMDLLPLIYGLCLYSLAALHLRPVLDCLCMCALCIDRTLAGPACSI